MENKELKELLEMEAKAQAEVKNLAEGNAEELKSAKEELVKLGEEISKIKELKMEAKNEEKSLGEKLKDAGFKAGSGELNLKAVIDYNNLTQTGQLDQLDSSIAYQPVEAPKVISLFPRISMITETYSYLDQDAVIRDAKGVAKCASSTHTTEETIVAKRVNDVLIKDTVDICLDYAEDYFFVEESARKLINDNLGAEIDNQLVLGTNSATSMNSIDNVSSEFSATNVDAPIGATIQQAQYVDLVVGMATQIEVLGKENAYMPNVVLANKMDVYKFILSAKTTEGQYLDPRVSVVNGQLYVAGLMVVTSPFVAANTVYVFDSSKGAILDRRTMTLQMSTENGTNFVDGFGTLKGTARLQFLVKDAEANAFMKCSDVAAGITAITAP